MTDVFSPDIPDRPEPQNKLPPEPDPNQQPLSAQEMKSLVEKRRRRRGNRTNIQSLTIDPTGRGGQGQNQDGNGNGLSIPT